MIGEASALGCAVLWALSSVMTKSQTATFDAFFINAFRCTVAAILFTVLALSTGRFDAFLHSPARTYLVLIGAALCVFVIGDTMYYRSMGLIGLSKALPIASCSPLFTLVISVTLYGESMSWLAMVGAFGTVCGVYLIASSRVQVQQTATPVVANAHATGVALALMAAVSWAVGTVFLRLGVEQTDVVAVNAFRTAVAAVLLVLLVVHRQRRTRVMSGSIPRVGGQPRTAARGSRARRLWILLGASVVGSGGMLLFVVGVKYAGAARATVLSSVAPLFAVPMSLVFLKERLDMRLPFGAVASMVGIWLVLTR